MGYYQVSGETDKVGIVFVDELHHRTLQSFVIRVQVFPQTFYSHFFPALPNKLVYFKVTFLKIFLVLVETQWLMVARQLGHYAGDQSQLIRKKPFKEFVLAGSD